MKFVDRVKNLLINHTCETCNYLHYNNEYFCYLDKTTFNDGKVLKPAGQTCPRWIEFDDIPF
jgi:hypothetical protein